MCVPKHIHFTFYHLVPSVIHVDGGGGGGMKQAGCVSLFDWSKPANNPYLRIIYHIISK